MKRRVVIIAFVALALSASGSWAQPAVVGTEQFFRLDWDATRDAGGRSVVEGHVQNASNYQAERMRLLVEGLDASGRVVSTTIGYVIGTVPAGNRIRFEVRAPAAQSYRVQVHSFDWTRCGDG